MQCHRENEKGSLVQCNTTLQLHFLRIMLTFGVTYNLDVWSMDVIQAYVQGNIFSRRAYLWLDPPFGLPQGHILRIYIPIYGLSDAGDAWWLISSECITSSLYFMQTTGDVSLMYADSRNNPCMLGV